MTKVPERVTKTQFFRLAFAGCLLWAAIAGCKETGEGIDPANGDGGAATEVGIPNGTAASKTIGAAGGKITSADGQVTLTIPAGALSKDTEIGIMPITNEAPNGLGLAYRFSPDGTAFAKPASLTFIYDPRTVSASSVDAFGVATQGSDRRWYRTGAVAVDTVAHSITTAMPHFSDWTAYEVAVLNTLEMTGADYVELGGSTELEMMFYNELAILAGQNATEFLEIADLKWRVIGGAANGSVKEKGGKQYLALGEAYHAIYTAPDKNPPSNPVTVVADIHLKGKKAALQVVKQILIGKDYFRGEFAGTPFDWENLHFMMDGNDLHIAGYNENPSQSLNLLLNNVDLNAPNRTYAYKARADEGAWAEFASNYTDETGGWISANLDCEKKAMRVSPGGITITQISIVNGVEYVQGHLSGMFYNLPGPCPIALRYFPIEGEFRIKNTFSSGRKPAALANFKVH